MTCLKEASFQGYIEETDASPFRRVVESRLQSCARCRATFDRVLARHRRVNSWLAKLSPPAEHPNVDTATALARVLSQRDAARLFATGTLRSTNPKALALSFFFQGAVVATLMLAGTNDAVRHKITQMTLIAPPPIAKPKPTLPKTAQAGGGGQHSPLPPLKGQLPKPAPRVFTPPVETIEHAALVIDPSMVAPADTWAASTSNIGNPLGVLGGGGGPGSRGGIGTGIGIGVGDGIGVGVDVGKIFTTPPSVLSKVDPEYSEEARKAKYSGAVMLSIVVNTDGRAEHITVVRSLGMGLDEKAIEAVQKWRFRPGTVRGVPVKVPARIEVNFRLL